MTRAARVSPLPAHVEEHVVSLRLRARAGSVQVLTVDGLIAVDQEGRLGSLACLEFDLSYESSAGDLVGNFYLPALARSAVYDRAAGYFSSSIFALVGLGMFGSTA